MEEIFLHGKLKLHKLQMNTGGKMKKKLDMANQWPLSSKLEWYMDVLFTLLKNKEFLREEFTLRISGDTTISIGFYSLNDQLLLLDLEDSSLEHGYSEDQNLFTKDIRVCGITDSLWANQIQEAMKTLGTLRWQIDSKNQFQ